MELFMSYINTKSLTFWAGAAAIGLGVMQILGVQNEQIPILSSLIVAFAGGGASDPGSLITLGFGMIGMRRAIAAATPAAK
jgi:hypothetical protein